jgi:hypothetical protein
MMVVPLGDPTSIFETSPCAAEAETVDWVGIAAGATLVAGGLLLLTGYRRAGTLAAASGATLALLNQRETLRSWWNRLPGYIDEFQHLLGDVQETVENIAVQRERLRSLIDR